MPHRTEEQESSDREVNFQMVLVHESVHSDIRKQRHFNKLTTWEKARGASCFILCGGHLTDGVPANAYRRDWLLGNVGFCLF